MRRGIRGGLIGFGAIGRTTRTVIEQEQAPVTITGVLVRVGRSPANAARLLRGCAIVECAG